MTFTARRRSRSRPTATCDSWLAAESSLTFVVGNRSALQVTPKAVILPDLKAEPGRVRSVCVDESGALLPCVIEMERTLGGLSQAVDSLTKQTEKHGDRLGDEVAQISVRLHNIETRIYTAGAVLVVLSCIMGLALPKAVGLRRSSTGQAVHAIISAKHAN